MSKRYDVIIIGAGIGGLVCGCYLAKAGKKVLIVEKNNKAGGYCTSFSKKGFIFDSSIHAIQDCYSKNGFQKIFQDLNVNKRVEFIKSNPSDTIIGKPGRVQIFSDVRKTILNFQTIFPSEKEALASFFNMLLHNSFLDFYSQYRRATYKNLLDSYFSDETLVEYLGVFVNNLGAISDQISALTALMVLKHFIVKGGYYPKGGMQRLADALLEEFCFNRGDILQNSLVDEILVKNGNAYGVMLKNEKIYEAKFVVSNSDMRYSLMHLLRKTFNTEDFEKKIKKFKTSYANFILYLRLSDRVQYDGDLGAGVWYMLDNSVIANQVNCFEKKIMFNNCIFCSIASKLDSDMIPENSDFLRLMVNTEFHSKDFWFANSADFSEKLIEQVDAVFVGVRNLIDCKGWVNPIHLYNYTLNYNGAIAGWLNTPSQVEKPFIKYIPSINGLFFTGHWVPQPYGNGGVAMAAESGRNTAREILKVI